jgi:uncharacterized protein
MKHTIKLLSVFIAVLVLRNIAICQDSTSHAAAALELLTMMNMEKTFAQTVDVIIAAQEKAMPEIKQYEEVMRTFYAKYINWESFKDKMVTIYAGEFTESELRGMIAFYKTDIGKKAIEKLPILATKGAEMGQQAVQDHMPELMEAIQKRENELNK